tara:strand:+ start:18141 stop:18953 length:813 start_codon:yes stop_codon:yes gene_type:complete
MTTRQKDFVHISHEPVLDIIQGSRPDMTNKEVEGVSSSLSSGVDKCVWTEDAIFSYTRNSNESNLHIVSTSTDDAAAGVGARTILVEGLKHSNVGGVHQYNVVSETITLNGTSNVNLVENYYRILKLSVATAGNNALNQGNIKVFDPTGGAVFGSMAAGDNTSNQAVISPSTGNDILLEKIHVMGHFETPVEIKVNIYEESKQLQKTIYKFFGSSNGNEFSLNVRKKLIAGDTLWVSVNPLAAVTGSHNRVAVLLEGTEKSKSVIIPSLV